MRMLAVMVGALVVACGGGPEPARGGADGAPAAPPAGASPPVTTPAAPPPPPVAGATGATGGRTGRVHEVRMGLERGRYYFEPAQLSIRPGDAVRWININAGPHNVHFKRNQVPPGAPEFLNAAMPRRMGDLQGPFVRDSLENYEILFVGAPPGSYTYVCSPHEMLGMVATLLVERPAG